MSINFPNSPSNGDTYTFNNTQYTWDGEKWDSSLSAIISNTFPGITVTGVSTLATVNATSFVGPLTGSSTLVGGVSSTSLLNYNNFTNNKKTLCNPW